MANTITTKDLDSAVQNYVRTLASSGITGDFWMQTGNKVNGVAFRLYMNDGTIAPGTVSGYLGMTRREAYNMLHTLARMAADVAYYQNEKNL